jgi:glutamate decarboxylase
VALHLSTAIGGMDAFELWNDGSDIPVFAWRLAKGYTNNWDLYDLSNQVRERRWLVPAYPMPDDLADLTVQRIVVRNGLSMDLADRLLDSLRASVTFLDGLSGPMPRDARRTTSFHH